MGVQKDREHPGGACRSAASHCAARRGEAAKCVTHLAPRQSELTDFLRMTTSVMKPTMLDATLRHTLSALIDTLFPPSALPDGVPLSKLGAIEAVEALTANLTWRERTDLLVLLRLLSTGVGTAALAHTWPTAFASLAPAERERVLLRLGASSVALRRKALHSLKALIGWASLTFVPDATGELQYGTAQDRLLALLHLRANSPWRCIVAQDSGYPNGVNRLRP